MDIEKVIKRLDDYYSINEFYGAEAHLNYWLKEAKLLNNRNACLTIINEQIGLYRTFRSKINTLAVIDDALTLVNEFPKDSIAVGITFVNIATGYETFDMSDKAIKLYTRAKKILEAALPEDDPFLGSMYNNMAVCYKKLKQYKKADSLIQKALKIMTEQGASRTELAIAYCNMADIIYESSQDLNDERIADCLRQSKELLEPNTRKNDARYIYACRKCSAIFGRLGDKETENELMNRVTIMINAARNTRI